MYQSESLISSSSLNIAVVDGSSVVVMPAVVAVALWFCFIVEVVRLATKADVTFVLTD